MQVVILIGIQATGKSTFYKDHFFYTHLRISLDMLKTRHREMEFIKTCLKTKQRFVVDNTNPTVENRKRYIELAKEAGYEVAGYYFESKIQDAIDRNQQREKGHVIPQKGIVGIYNKMQLPSYNEGFDALYYVRIGRNGMFEIDEWMDDL